MAAEESKEYEEVLKDPFILDQYNRILTAFSEVGISVGFYSSQKEDDGCNYEFPVNPLMPFMDNNRVILRLYVNGTEIGECNGERAGLYTRRVFLAGDGTQIPEVDEYQVEPEIGSFVIYWIKINHEYRGRYIAILLLHLIMFNVILRTPSYMKTTPTIRDGDDPTRLLTFHLEDDSDRSGSNINNIYKKSLFDHQIGIDSNEPERFLFVSRLFEKPRVTSAITEYINFLRTRTLVASNTNTIPPLIQANVERLPADLPAGTEESKNNEIYQDIHRVKFPRAARERAEALRASVNELKLKKAQTRKINADAKAKAKAEAAAAEAAAAADEKGDSRYLLAKKMLGSPGKESKFGGTRKTYKNRTKKLVRIQ